MEPDGEGVLEVRENVSWAAFEAVVAGKRDKAVPRVTYLDGVLELVTPSRGHERTQAWVSWLLGTYADVNDITLSTFGSWLLQNKKAGVGAEPDDCYIVGDPTSRDRPDFVVEVQWSRRRLDKLEVYRRLDVRECWIWPRSDAQHMDIHVWHRGAWRVRERSLALPDLDLDCLCSFLDRTTTTGAVRDYRTALLARQ